jgi:hypothetical protein
MSSQYNKDPTSGSAPASKKSVFDYASKRGEDEIESVKEKMTRQEKEKAEYMAKVCVVFALGSTTLLLSFFCLV